MSEIILPEQDVINSICLFYAREKYIMPEEVEVELIHDDDRGFEAEVFARGIEALYNEGNMISAIRLWIEEYHGMNPYSAAVRLELSDEKGVGIIAHINE